MKLSNSCLALLVVALVASTTFASPINVALASNGGTATAISEGYYNGVTKYASNAIDGNLQSDWCSEWSMPAWLKVQFNKQYLIDRVAVDINYHQQTFAISLSPDGINWTQVVAPQLSTNIPTSYPTYQSAGSAYEVFDLANPVLAEYMRVDITTTSAPSSHIFQADVGEVEAYATPEPTTLSLLGLGLAGLIARHKRK